MEQASEILLEVCVDTAAGLCAAIAGGADRIELCAALETGGLTPSAGLMQLAAAAGIPTRAMIRPRAGDFVYDGDERSIMMHDIDAARAAGLSGVVIGATAADGGLDLALLAALAQHAAGLDVTLHRAVDLLPDPVESVDQAIALGMATILTSGGALTAAEGIGTIAAMQDRAAGRIEILAGSGIAAANVREILRLTGVTAVHASCSRASGDADPRALAMGFASDRRSTDEALVRALRAAASPFPRIIPS